MLIFVYSSKTLIHAKCVQLTDNFPQNIVLYVLGGDIIIYFNDHGIEQFKNIYIYSEIPNGRTLKTFYSFYTWLNILEHEIT